MNKKFKLNVIGLLTIVVMVLVVLAGNNHVVDNQTKKGPDYDGAQYGVKCYYLERSTDDAKSSDTLATTEKNFYGPYDLAPDGLTPATSFTLQADVITGTTPTASFDYQITWEKEITDTSSVWTAADTLGATAQNASISVSGAGKYIWFQINNYDGTDTEIPDMVRVVIPTGTSVYKVVK